MNRQMLICCAIGLALIAGTAGLLKQVGSRQVLAPPGVKTHPLQDSIRLEVDLPKNLPGYTSEEIKVDDLTLSTLPKDTSFGMRRYRAADGQTFDLRVVLMGRDRTSMHKPQICLTGQGWRINDLASAETAVRVQRPVKYNLPVVRLVTSAVDAQNQPYGGLYVYWYVADDGLSASATGFQRMWWMARKLLTTGVLQRWAYVSCVAACPLGQETARFERVKEFIAAAVPEFQLYPRGKIVAVAATP